VEWSEERLARLRGPALTDASVVSFQGWTRDEAKLLLQTIGRYVNAQVRPLKDEIAQLKARIAELEATGIKFVGSYQRAAEYRRGDVTNHEGAMWVATCAVPVQEVPGKSVCWQLTVKSYSNARQPTLGGARPQTITEKRTP
jgi:hypothetical protein